MKLIFVILIIFSLKLLADTNKLDLKNLTNFTDVQTQEKVNDHVYEKDSKKSRMPASVTNKKVNKVKQEEPFLGPKGDQNHNLGKENW